MGILKWFFYGENRKNKVEPSPPMRVKSIPYKNSFDGTISYKMQPIISKISKGIPVGISVAKWTRPGPIGASSGVAGPTVAQGRSGKATKRHEHTPYELFMRHIPTCKFGYNYMMYAHGKSTNELEDLIVSIKTKISGKEIHKWHTSYIDGFHLYVVFEKEEDYTLVNLIHADDSVKIERVVKTLSTTVVK